MKAIFALVMLLIMVGVPSSRLYAQTTAQAPNNPDLAAVLAAIGIVIGFGAIPLIYYFRTQPPRHQRGVLVVSTDEMMREIINTAATKAGCQAVMVYRYEDALNLLNRDVSLRAVVLDDSVPQHEAGILVSSLSTTLPVRPLLLILDSRDIEHTKLSYRAEILLTKPVNRKSLEEAIRQVVDKADPA